MVGTFIKFEYKRLKKTFEIPGREVVFQCRDEGPLRAKVWISLRVKNIFRQVAFIRFWKRLSQKYFQPGCVQTRQRTATTKGFWGASARLLGDAQCSGELQEWSAFTEDILTLSPMVMKVLSRRLSKSLLQISDTGTYICFAPDHPPSPGSQVSMYLAVTKSG